MFKPFVGSLLIALSGLFAVNSGAQASASSQMNSQFQKQSNVVSQMQLQSLQHVAANTTKKAKKKRYNRRTIVFNPKKLRWYAYNEHGRLVKSGRASGGAHYCRDVGRACRTPTGTFYIYSKGGYGCKSSKYPRPRGGAKMPYCMHFHKAGYAIHGSYDLPNRNASHGCIRVHPKAAKWMSRHFVRHGTRVIVKSY